MKDILLYVESNTGVTIDKMAFCNINIVSTNISTVISELSKDGKYTLEEVAFNLLGCNKYHLLDMEIKNQNNSHVIQSATSYIYGLTLEGIAFIDKK
jgi:hypothetical protein